jgi:hypothetical protein
MRVTASGALGMAIAAAIAIGTPQPASAATQLRGAQATSRKLIADGMTRSPTIRRLVQRLEASDVIVYVDVRNDLPAHVAGSTRFVARTATHRVVRIALNRDRSWPTLIAFLGHELQHACEVAEARTIDSADSMRAYYRTFGVRLDRDAFDTHEAREVGRIVEAELRGKPSEIERVAMLRRRTF